jgi:hypothetical protein
MKRLKFKPELCEMILGGVKTATWRLFDDKNLALGDEIEFINSESGAVIGTGKITKLKLTTLGNLDETDWDGHETFASEAEMYETYRGYYGDKVGSDSELKIITFTFDAKT